MAFVSKSIDRPLERHILIEIKDKEQLKTEAKINETHCAEKEQKEQERLAIPATTSLLRSNIYIRIYTRIFIWSIW